MLARVPGVRGFAEGGRVDEDPNGLRLGSPNELRQSAGTIGTSAPGYGPAAAASTPSISDIPTASPEFLAQNVGRAAPPTPAPVRYSEPRPITGAEPVAAAVAPRAAPVAAVAAAPAAAPTYRLNTPEGSNALRGYPTGPTPANTVAGTASGTGPNGQPMSREYTQGDLARMSGSGVSGGGGIGADGMTDAQRMNAPFHQAYTQMQAEKKGQEASQAQFINDNAQRNQRLAAAPGYREMEMAKSAARSAQFRATDGADMVLRSSGSPTGGNPARAQRLAILGAARNAQDRLGQMEGQVQAANVSPRRDLVAEQIAQQHGADASATSQLGAAQTALMNPLAVQQAKQGLSSAGTAQDIAKITLGEHQLRQGLLKEYATPGTTPERQAQIHDALLAQSNKDRPNLFTAHETGGGKDPITGLDLPKSLAITNARTGDVKVHGPQAQGGPSYTKGERRTMNGETREFDGKEWKKI